MTQPTPADIWVIIPAYNEEKVIRQTLEEVLAHPFQVVVIDDCSTDQTAAAAKDLPIHFLQHPINMGQGAALQTGNTYAQAQGAQWVVHFDADGQHRVADILPMVAPLWAGEADITLGSRFLAGGSGEAMPALRKAVLKLGRIFHGLLTGLWLTDAHNGYRALNAKALATIHITQNGMAHNSEIIQETARHQLRYKEVPVVIRYSDYSLAKGQSIWNAANIVGDLLVKRLFQ
ncbi:MAG: glycosyltransferase family 2 protein [Bacteroidota bacterium]